MVLILPLLLALTATLANAQELSSDYVAGLIQYLNASNFVNLSLTMGVLNRQGPGSQLLAGLSDTSRDFTLFAPNDDAFGATTSSTDWYDLLAYHLVYGHYDLAYDYPNTTVGRTAFGNPDFVMLEGNMNQVVVWSRRADNQVHILNQGDDPQVISLSYYQNIVIVGISAIMSPPGDIESTFEYNNQLSGFANLTQSTQVSSWNTANNNMEEVSVTQVLNGVRGLTLFVPNNDAMTQGLPQISGNDTQVWNVLRNHILNGTTVYSPSLNGSTYVTAGGENLQFTTNGTDHFVTSGNTTARIVQPDVLTKNGVIHIIDQFLINSDVDQNAADDAYNSASSAVGHTTTQTNPIGVPTVSSNSFRFRDIRGANVKRRGEISQGNRKIVF